MEQEKEMGLRKPSTYSQRAKEFATPNPDYLGNDYLKKLSEKFLEKQFEKRIKGLELLLKLEPKNALLKRRLKGLKMLAKK